MITGDFSYVTGVFNQFVPPFLTDSAVIRPFGEYGLDTTGYATALGGAYGINYQSSGSVATTDLQYLWQNELQVISSLKQVLIAFYWYTPENSTSVMPAIGPEVQANTWSGTAPPAFQAGTYTQATAYQLKATHQVWPSLNDAALVTGIQWLQGKGYQVGLIPINVFLSTSLYFAGGGEWEIDRSSKQWDSTSLLSYLTSYKTFITSYIDLCVANKITPSLFSIGYGMRDLTGIADRTQIPVIISTLQGLLSYCKTKLPNTKTTYFADLDEYYYPFLALTKIDGAMDALWTYPDLDFIGINWFAPLALDNNEDTNFLTQNVTRGEGYSYTLNNFVWRNSLNDRLLSTTTNDFKTSLSQTAIDPRIYAVKNIQDWLAFSHYTPASSNSAGCTPPAGVSDPTRICSNIQSAKPISLPEPLSPSTGGIFKDPDEKNAYLQMDISATYTFTFPSSIPDSSILNFEFEYSLGPNQSGNIFKTSFGLSLDYVDSSAVLSFDLVSIPLFTAWSGKIGLVYQSKSVNIYVNGAFDQTITGTFRMPTSPGSMTFGGWIGYLYYIKLLLGTGDNLSGGEFYFYDAYAGIRTAWKPGLKKWIAIAGYGSMQGSAADPFTRPQTILWSGAASVPLTYEHEATLNAAVFRNNYHVKDIQIPYGCAGSIDQAYQSIVFYSELMGLLPAGPESISAWFLDTRSYAAMTNIMSDGSSQQIFNDAFDVEINASLNGKTIIHNSVDPNMTLDPTIDGALGLSSIPGALPPLRAILIEPGVAQK